MIDKLKPCPFCGSTYIAGPILYNLGNYRWGIHCVGCSARIEIYLPLRVPDHVAFELESNKAKAMAISRWNRRDGATLAKYDQEATS